MRGGNISNTTFSLTIVIRLEDTVFDIIWLKKPRFKKLTKHLDIKPRPDGLVLCTKILRNEGFKYRFAVGEEFREHEEEILGAFQNHSFGLFFGSLLYLDQPQDMNVYLRNGMYACYIDDNPDRRELVEVTDTAFGFARKLK